MQTELVVLLCLLSLAYGGKSPNGEKFFARLSPEEKSLISKELMEDALLDVPGLINKYGYVNETYDVQTEDNYILTVHRIAGKKNENIQPGKRVVFLMHGLMGSSSNWIINGPHLGLGYILSDAGYDVWMGNARGSYYSRKHTHLNPDTSRKYWMFSWDQIGRYDLPAMIDYILAKTGQSKLHYIGHSQGTTTFFVMASERPEFNGKIHTMQAFAPPVYMGNVRSPFVRYMAKYASSLQYLFTLIGQNEFLPQSPFFAEFGHKYCSPDSQYKDLCIIYLFGADDMDAANETMIPLYLSHGPAGASSRQWVHYAQGHLSKQFRNYDYGFVGNLVYYDSIAPRKYPLRRVTAPVALHYGLNDGVVNETDVLQLLGEIKNPIGAFRVARPTWGHLDFIWAVDARERLYDMVLQMMKTFDAQDEMNEHNEVLPL